jgi:hypothetical protein
LEGIKQALYTKNKRSNKANILPEPDDEPHYGGAKFWSPGKGFRSFVLKEVIEADAQAEIPHKAETKELRAIEKELHEKEKEGKRQKRAQDKTVQAAMKARQRVEIDARKTARTAKALAKKTAIQERRNQRADNPKPRPKANTNKVVEAPKVRAPGPGPSTRTTRAGRTVSRPARFS